MTDTQRFTSRIRTARTIRWFTPLINMAEAPAWSPQPNQIAWIEQTGPGDSVINVFDLSLENKILHCSARGQYVRPHSVRF